MGLIRRLFPSLVIIFTSIPTVVRADLGNEYKSQEEQKESLSWDRAQFTGRGCMAKIRVLEDRFKRNDTEQRYQILKNGDLYRLYTLKCFDQDNDDPEIKTDRIGNIYSVERSSRRECNSGSYGINCANIGSEIQYKSVNCRLVRYGRSTRNSYVGEITETEIATCRPGFTQRSK